MDIKTIILAIDDVEPGLVRAVKAHSKKLGKPLQGLVLVNENAAGAHERTRDESGFFKEISCNFDDPAELQTTLKPYADKILAVTCRQERSVQNLRKVVPFLPYVNTPSESALLWATQKHLMRDRLRAYDERLTPQYCHLTSFQPEDTKKLLKELNLPVIVKPAGLASSVLVTRCDTDEELTRTLEHTFKVITEVYSRDAGRGRPSLLVEEIIEGEMYSTDAYVSPTGEVTCLPFVRIFTAHSLGMEGFYGYNQVIPTALKPDEITRAEKVATKAIKALNLSSTTAHVELFLMPSGEWKIIELGPRIGGYREELYREAYGIDHYYNDLAVRMALPVEVPTKLLKHAAGIMIYAEKEGTIKAVHGFEEARKVPSMVSLSCYAKPGDTALFAGNGGRVLCEGIFSNANPRRLEIDINKVRKLIKFDIV